ncbi:MAG: response regulator [Planctomycetota bacterium]
MCALVISNSPHQRRLISNLLSRTGYLVREAADEIEGLARYRILSPHIVVIDASLPGMGGIELCRTIRANEAGSNPFVLLLMGREQESLLFEAVKAGMDDYVTLPFQPWALLSRITAGERILGLQTMEPA